jgi:hypothetical protein
LQASHKDRDQTELECLLGISSAWSPGTAESKMRAAGNRTGNAFAGGTFKVDYMLFGIIVLALLCIGLLFANSARQKQGPTRQMILAERARKRREREAQRTHASDPSTPRQKAILQRALNRVPTPWGWPGSDARADSNAHTFGITAAFSGPSRPLQHWIDRLLAEKRTIDDITYRERGNTALRSMVEDRFGRNARPKQMAYQKVRPPLLRDPSLPHDQMDNFPSGKTDSIISGLASPPETTSRTRHPSAIANRKSAQLGDIKTPWGW